MAITKIVLITPPKTCPSPSAPGGALPERVLPLPGKAEPVADPLEWCFSAVSILQGALGRVLTLGQGDRGMCVRQLTLRCLRP